MIRRMHYFKASFSKACTTLYNDDDSLQTFLIAIDKLLAPSCWYFPPPPHYLFVKCSKSRMFALCLPLADFRSFQRFSSDLDQDSLLVSLTKSNVSRLTILLCFWNCILGHCAARGPVIFESSLVF